MRGALDRVVISMPTHRAPRWRVVVTSVMAERKKHRQAVKRRSGALVKARPSRMLVRSVIRASSRR